MPAGPSRVNRWQVRSSITCSRTSSRRRRSRSRPITGAAKPSGANRAPGPMPGCARPSRRWARSGAFLPWTTRGPTGSLRTSERIIRRVVSAMRISSGSAASSSRDAMLTASPVTPPPVPGPPTVTSPVLMPMRIRNRNPQSRCRSALSAAMLARISKAARAARNASSSCSTGMPKTANTASPMNFSTVPPWAEITSRAALKNRHMTCCNGSESSCSPIAV